MTVPTSARRASARPAGDVADQAADEDAVAASGPDPDRFGVIFDRYFAEIHGYLARRLGTDVADDLAAETFETAFRKRAGFDPDRGNVRAWLYGIATRHMSRYRRQEVRSWRALARSAAPGPAEGPEERVTDRVAAQAEHRRIAGRWRNFRNATPTCFCSSR